MKTKTYSFIIVSFFIMSISFSIKGSKIKSDLTTLELIERARSAVTKLYPLEVRLETKVHISGSIPAEKTYTYKLGEKNNTLINIGTQYRIITNKNKVIVQNTDVPNRYMETPFIQDLGRSLAMVRGKSRTAGFREPPHSVLRDGRSIKDFCEAMRLSSWLGELKITSPPVKSGKYYELLFTAENGKCILKLNASTFIPEKTEYKIHPINTPKGYRILITGSYHTTHLANGEDTIKFDPSQKIKVSSLRKLSSQAPGIPIPAQSIISSKVLLDNLINMETLAGKIENKQLLLIGEDHIYHEPPRYLCNLVDLMKKRKTRLLLELPRHIQPMIDKYMKDGNEEILEKIFFKQQVLQLQDMLRWAFANRETVIEVSAIDEPLWEIMLKRSFLEDTRNYTMAKAVFKRWKQYPDDRIIFYAGQLHLLKTGRYKEDRPNRDTAGSRLTRMGIPEDQIIRIMMNGNKNFHLHSIWKKPGILPMHITGIRIPIPYFIDYPIFGGTYADQFFDYFINLGKMTRIDLSTF